jgi:high affinity Mn2+ porin
MRHFSVLVRLSLRSLCVSIAFLAALPLTFAQTPLASQPQPATLILSQNTPILPPYAPPTDPNLAPSTDPTADSSEEQPAEETSPSDMLTMFPHSETSRYWVSGQGNLVLQWHPTFPAKYSGPNSLSAPAQSATTHVLTVYTGYQLTRTTEIFGDAEYATGGGIGTALGLAGYTNLDSVRTVQGVALAEVPYLARLMVRQIIPLTDERWESSERDEFHLATSLPPRRIEIRAGKFDLADFFDSNSYGSDSHLQFLNWTVDNNGAYDYAANTRGYTDGILVEYDDHWWTVRFAEVLMPKIANGDYLDANITRAGGTNLEFEARGKRVFNKPGVLRVLSYMNRANMGNYDEAIAEFLAHETPAPNVNDTSRQGRHKYGFGINYELDLTSAFSIFGRLGWNDGHNESFAYTEVDRTALMGFFAKGAAWHRHNDRAGVAFVANGLSAAHSQYLALGGLGFLLGDGALSYGSEQIVECFYTAHVWRGLFAAFDLQHINNPGYNQARGPVTVPGVRLHIDF